MREDAFYTHALLSMQTDVFPDFAVKQAFRELKRERDDDMIIVSLQSDLLTRCLMQILKGAVCSCIIHKRKFLNERDLVYSLNTTHFPRSAVKSRDKGYLLDTCHFGQFCSKHIDVLIGNMRRDNILGNEEIKVSADLLVLLQENTERLLRGFMEEFANANRRLGYREFDAFMNQLLGDQISSQEEFLPFT